jgi:hypothetical protein
MIAFKALQETNSKKIIIFYLQSCFAMCIEFILMKLHMNNL